jgi:hypothetical protein
LGLFFCGGLRQIVVSSVDRTLHAKAQIFTGLMHEEHGRVELELSEIIAGEYVIPRSGHYYRVMKGRIFVWFYRAVAVRSSDGSGLGWGATSPFSCRQRCTLLG